MKWNVFETVLITRCVICRSVTWLYYTHRNEAQRERNIYE